MWNIPLASPKTFALTLLMTRLTLASKRPTLSSTLTKRWKNSSDLRLNAKPMNHVCSFNFGLANTRSRIFSIVSDVSTSIGTLRTFGVWPHRNSVNPFIYHKNRCGGIIMVFISLSLIWGIVCSKFDTLLKTHRSTKPTSIFCYVQV